jgi:predicted ATPase/DNA-binding winged helix-turn-helix (wHTH) protein
VPDPSPGPLAPGSTLLRFGPAGRFELQPAERRLLVDGRPAALGARALDVLITLAGQPDHLVTKNELLDRVWPGLVVEEANLQVQISNLRKLLGGDVIATVPGRGYRFMAPVDRTAERPGPAPGAGEPPAGPLVPTNLPAEAPTLYGRDDDVALVRGLVESHRLVTVVGAGGIGKTRVALAAAHSLSSRHADGTWLVELAPVADPGLLPGSIAHALGLQLRGQRPPLDELIAALQPQRLLLMLDNCEHLVEATSLLAQAIVTRTPHVRLLVTSQEALRLPAEQQYRLGPLAIPPTSERLEPSDALAFGAVRLFVERVVALDPRFRLDARHVAVVADICRQLDGLALAIELAAARVPSLGVEGVRQRLGERLRVLTAGSRIALRRHQTLRAALDWSHGLLASEERAVFRRVGVFSGGFTVEAAQRVASDEALDEWAVLDHLSGLVDKSLVVADGDDRPRYRLLESARAYALEKLAESGETDALARRHACFYADHFRCAADALFAGTSTEDAFTAARSVEIDNLRAALAWALGDAGDLQVALTLVAQTAPLCFLLPSHGECERWRGALSRRVRVAALTPPSAALHAYAQILWGVQGLRLAEPGTEPPPTTPDAVQALEDPPRQAHAALVLAVQSTWHGDRSGARAALDEYDRLGPAGLPLWLAALRLHVEIRAAYLAGDAPDKRTPLEQLLSRLAAAGEGDGRAAFMLRTHLAEDSLLRERFEEAAERFGALAELGRRQRRDVYRMCFVLGPLIVALTETGRLDEATAVALEALPLLQHTGMRADYAPALALVVARRGDLPVAARMLGAGDAHLERAGGCRLLLERRARERVVALLQAHHCAAEIERWMNEGASLGEEAFARLVAQA